MTRLLPYPLLAASLLLMWLLLNGPTPGHLLLGAIVAVAATWTMSALQPAKPRLRRWRLIFRLAGIVFVDVARSNVAVARIIVAGRTRRTTSGFMTVPLTLRDPTALAVLACILTATPGTAWVEYRSKRDILVLHILDLADEQHWLDLVKTRYESLLMEIFE